MTVGMKPPAAAFVYADLPVLGLDRNDLRHLLDTGLVRRVLHGVYVPSTMPDTQEVRARAASLVMPPHGVVSDRSAAWLHGVDAYDPAESDHPSALEVVSMPGHEPLRRKGFLGGKRELLAAEVTVVGGVPVTIPLRTSCDLGCLRGRSGAFAAMTAISRRFGLTRHDYLRMLPRFAGRRGVIQLRDLVGVVDPRVESHGEAWTLLAIHDAGLPLPEPQVWIELPGFGRVRVDFGYRGARVVVEYDGEEFHSTEEQREADRKRRDALRDAGWRVIVVRKHQFRGPGLDMWVAEVRDALESRRSPARRYARASVQRHLPHRG